MKRHLRNLWLWKCNLPEDDLTIPINRDSKVSLEQLRDSEWSPFFESLMRSRLIIGALRYGELNKPGKPKYNRIESIKKRLDMYNQTGNKEHLVDCANLCLLEFEECNHPNEHFKSIDDGHHTKKI